MLTPVDIQNKTFKGGIGFDKKDVEIFMQIIANDYERLYSSNVELKDKVNALNESLRHYRSMEDSLQKAMTLSEKTSEETVNAANEKARQITMEAEKKAEAILADSKGELQSLKDEIFQLTQQFSTFKKQYRTILQSQMNALDGEVINIDLGADYESQMSNISGGLGGFSNEGFGEGGLGGGLGGGYVGNSDNFERTNQDPAINRGSLNTDPFSDATNGGGRFSMHTNASAKKSTGAKTDLKMGDGSGISMAKNKEKTDYYSGSRKTDDITTKKNDNYATATNGAAQSSYRTTDTSSSPYTTTTNGADQKVGVDTTVGTASQQAGGMPEDSTIRQSDVTSRPSDPPSDYTSGQSTTSSLNTDAHTEQFHTTDTAYSAGQQKDSASESLRKPDRPQRDVKAKPISNSDSGSSGSFGFQEASSTESFGFHDTSTLGGFGSRETESFSEGLGFRDTSSSSESFEFQDAASSSESFGFRDTASSSESFGFQDTASSSESFGFRDTASSSESFGFQDTNSASESYGFQNKGTASPESFAFRGDDSSSEEFRFQDKASPAEESKFHDTAQETVFGEVESKVKESSMLDSEDNYVSGFDFVNEEESPLTFRANDNFEDTSETYTGEVEDKIRESSMLDSEDNYVSGFDFIDEDGSDSQQGQDFSTQSTFQDDTQSFYQTENNFDEEAYQGEVEDRLHESTLLDSEDNYTGGFDFINEDTPSSSSQHEDGVYVGEVEDRVNESTMLDSEDNYSDGFDFVIGNESEEEDIPTILHA